ncbi:hypothetical protein WICPIJ_008738 [Wickerhamomyces pijperi]|uniref:beta-glucosidase n=1 Tax=Wickerhamomyces pijperi TaxID=599730 RepID=A0A9P8THS6_WICPI|nr:hypothetical protein WICPIJ_008738 [Wickerhamomyces pijperi]
MSDFDIEEVLSQLTIEEKIDFLAGYDNWHTAAVPRLNIPSIRVSDGPNGVRGVNSTEQTPGAILPNGTGIASTFNKDLIYKAGELMGEEAVHKSVHVILGPTTNMHRGPNGGRGFESFSEDPYLAGMVTSEIIKGIQSKKVAATLKHFVCNDLEDDRYGVDAVVTERALREIYLEPFRLALKNSDPKALMTSYNRVNGEHVSNSKKLIKGLLKEEWGWQGTVMSDWFGTYTNKESIENGLDLEMPGPARFRTVETVSHQVGTRELHVNDLNDRVRGVLKLVKHGAESGIPSRGPEDTKNNTPETSSFLRKLGGESIVLLKNEGGLLPLQAQDKIAVIGPNAKFSATTGGGSASLTPYYTTTPYNGISQRAGYDPVYTVGCHAHKSLPGLAEHCINPVTGLQGVHAYLYNEAPETANRKPAFKEFNFFNSTNQFYDIPRDEGFQGKTLYVDIVGVLEVDEDAEYDFGLTVVGVGQLFIDGQLVVDNKTDQKAGGTFYGYGSVEELGKISLKKGHKYDIKVQFHTGPGYKINDPVNLTSEGVASYGFSKIIDKDQEIARAVELAESVEKVVLVIGTNGDWETESTDRENITLPRATDELVAAVLKANPNTIIVNQSGTPCEFPWIQDAKAVMQAWFGGCELGNAIADVLYGAVNPSGKLSLTFPKKFEDNPAYLNFRSDKGRVLYGEDIFIGYRYYEKLQKQVLFPFGYGLSYTRFKFDGLSVSVDEAADKISVSLQLKNIGQRQGMEVVQVYFAAKNPDIIRPVKELKGFEKVDLQPGETRDVVLDLILKDSLSYFDEYENMWSLKADEYDVLVGSSSDDIELRETFSITNSKLWKGL